MTFLVNKIAGTHCFLQIKTTELVNAIVDSPSLQATNTSITKSFGQMAAIIAAIGSALTTHSQRNIPDFATDVARYKVVIIPCDLTTFSQSFVTATHNVQEPLCSVHVQGMTHTSSGPDSHRCHWNSVWTSLQVYGRPMEASRPLYLNWQWPLGDWAAQLPRIA